jgi:hypothetical protein
MVVEEADVATWVVVVAAAVGIAVKRHFTSTLS